MVDGTDFSFETLSKQEAIERKQPRLTKFEPSFWDQLRAYLSTLGESLKREQERNPSSRKIALLQDELRNASRKAEALWEAREKKITLFALKNARAADAPPPENLLKAELALFNELVATLRKHVPTVVVNVDTRDAPAPAPTPPPTPAPRPSASPPPVAPSPAPTPTIPAQSPPAHPPPSPRPSDEAVTVRALVDVPPFVGLDGKTYRLKKGDVLTLPKRMVDVLAKRGQVAVMA